MGREGEGGGEGESISMYKQTDLLPSTRNFKSLPEHSERCSLTCFERYMYSSRRARELSALYGLSPPLPPSQLHPSPFFGSVGQSTVGLVDRSKAMESNLRGHMGRKLIGDENKLDRLSIVLDLLLPSNVLSHENMAVFILSPFFFVCAVRDNTLAQTLSLSLSRSLSLARSLSQSYPPSHTPGLAFRHPSSKLCRHW